MTSIAVVVVLVLVLPIGFDVMFRPGIRRVGFRNVARRPSEASLVVIGSMLATALIVASFVVGNSFGASFRARAETRLGPLDMLIYSEEAQEDFNALRTQISNREAAGEPSTIESMMSIVEGEVNVANAEGNIEPLVTFWEIDPQQAKTFGNDLAASGLSDLPNDIASDQVVINDEIANELDLAEGETLQLVAGAHRVTFEIVAVLPKKGLIGFAPLLLGPNASATIVPPGVNPDDVARTSIAISNVGDTYEGVDSIPTSETFIRSVLGEDTTITNVKQFTLDRADRIADRTTTRFSTVGGFSVAAGVLLLVNLFVMLASERKVDLGTMRAIGVQRSHTRRAFSVEGLIYGLIASVLGVVVGVGVAAAVIRFAADSFGGGADFTISLSVQPLSLFSGAIIGLAISLVTVWLTTLRLVRINIVAALKDAVAPRSSGHTRIQLLVGVLVTVLGVLAWVIASDRQVVAFLAPIAVALGVVPALSALLGQKFAIFIGGGFGLFWAATVFGLLPDTFEDTAIELFLVQGVCLVGLAVTVFAAFDVWLIALVRLISGGSISTRLGLSNPLARPIRTALLVAMYALVIFTVTFMAILNSVLDRQGPVYVTQAGGSYDLIVESSAISPISTEDLANRADVAVALEVTNAAFLIASPHLDADDEGPAAKVEGDLESALAKRRLVTMVPSDFVDHGPPALTHRADEYASDKQVWQAIVDDPSLAIAPNYRGLSVGDLISFEDNEGNRSNITIVGLSDWNWMVGAGLYVSDKNNPFSVNEAPGATRQYVAATDGADIASLTDNLEVDFAGNGAEVNAFSESIKREAAEREAFVQILQGFLGLGLCIGIMGLSVVLIRGVRERRQQLGMLRAVGFSAKVLRDSFLVEAGFIGLQGVVLGVALGIVSSWQVLTNSSAFEQGLTFAVPYVRLTILATVAFVASLLAGIFPAFRAGRINPAEALRQDT